MMAISFTRIIKYLLQLSYFVVCSSIQITISFAIPQYLHNAHLITFLIVTCDSNPCQNGGTCIDEGDGFMCDCTSGFTGVKCDIEGTFLFSWSTSPHFPRNCMPQYTAYRLCMYVQCNVALIRSC